MPLTDQSKRDLLEIHDDLYDKSAAITTSQLDIKEWHAYIDDPTLADATLDRVVHPKRKVLITVMQSMRHIGNRQGLPGLTEFRGHAIGLRRCG